jgi:glycosyltransferase involved in cell wall biosynthesis
MGKDSPLVSVVMPVHNGEKYIEEALSSCFDQTYKNIEVVVVDDKSTDGTLDLLRRLETRKCNKYWN